nr:mitochondrial chaperone bcs1 [Colletotrichum truncatum]KAF6793202.1 mitochondrial chaperone bcs1 [Colletotrichum truncatum]
MSDVLKFAKASFLSGATDATSQGLSDLLERSAPGFSALQKFFSRWFRLDLTTIVLLISFSGDIPNALNGIQKLWTQIYWWITRFFTASISIASNDKLNREVLNWLGAHVLTRQGTRVLTAKTEIIQNDAWYYRKPIERDDLHHEKRVPVQYLPTFGTTWFYYEGGFFMIRRIPLRSPGAHFGIPDEYSAAPQGDEPLVVMRLGRSIKAIKEFLDNCRNFADRQRESFITVRTTKNQYGQEAWDTTILRPIRPLETVHFDEQTKKDLVSDIETYLDPATRNFYTERGIPYRRGFLLYGPPGTGKTSLSLALASYFNLELYLVHIPSIRGDGDLENLFTALPPKCIVLLEDIDAVGIERRKKLDMDIDSGDESSSDSSERDFGRCQCTLSGLLNVMDGVASQEGRIVLMTSNVAHKLDKALVRPGRIDRMIYLGNISHHSAKSMFERMYRPHTSGVPTLSKTEADATLMQHQEQEFDNLAEDFSKQIPDDIFTPAQLQGFLLKYRGTPKTAVERIAEWVIEEKAIMDEGQRRKKEEAARKARKKKALKLKALKALASTNDAESSDEAAEVVKDKNVRKEITDTNALNGVEESQAA